jgi:tetratricopeptide (TPR) repeat protein
MIRLVELINNYEIALNNVNNKNLSAEEKVFEILFFRNKISKALKGKSLETLEQVNKISELDNLLREEKGIFNLIEKERLTEWQNVLQVSSDEWWWKLNESSADLKWNLLTGFALTASLTIGAFISSKFLLAGIDTVGIGTVFSQVFFGFLAGSAMTEAGKKIAEKIFLKIGVDQINYARCSAVISLVLLIATILFYLSLPLIARAYNFNGTGLKHLSNSQDPARFQKAISNFKHAISLNSNFAQAHYNLAEAYEDSFDINNAIISYQNAIQSDATMYPAYNNLARLYILNRNDAATALKLINKAFSYAQDDSLARDNIAIRYTLLKNRGWAYYALKSYDYAKKDLMMAVRLIPENPSGHCLLSKVLEAIGENDAAQKEQSICYSFGQCDSEKYSEPALGVEPIWCISTQISES